MQAMILAAGFGTRLLPYTQYRPKPLFPVINRPLLQCTIEMLRRFGAGSIVVNCHHLRQQIVDEVSGIDGVSIQEEETILGTGGGVRRAVNKLVNEPLLLTNGDIYHTIDVEKLYRHHVQSGAGVTLAMHDYPRFNTVDVRGGEVIGFGNGDKDTAKRAFTGIHVIQPEILNRIVDGQYSCIIELYRTLLQEKVTIAAYDSTACFWSDMGTIDDYLALNRDILVEKVPRLPVLGRSQGMIHRGKNVHLHPSVCLAGWCVLGDNVHVEQGVRLENVVVWDNVVVKKNSEYINTIVAG